MNYLPERKWNGVKRKEAWILKSHKDSLSRENNNGNERGNTCILNPIKQSLNRINVKLTIRKSMSKKQLSSSSLYLSLSLLNNQFKYQIKGENSIWAIFVSCVFYLQHLVSAFCCVVCVCMFVCSCLYVCEFILCVYVA